MTNQQPTTLQNKKQASSTERPTLLPAKTNPPKTPHFASETTANI